MWVPSEAALARCSSRYLCPRVVFAAGRVSLTGEEDEAPSQQQSRAPASSPTALSTAVRHAWLSFASLFAQRRADDTTLQLSGPCFPRTGGLLHGRAQSSTPGSQRRHRQRRPAPEPRPISAPAPCSRAETAASLHCHLPVRLGAGVVFSVSAAGLR